MNFPQFVVIHAVNGFSIINEAEVDIFLEFPCFLHDLTNVDNLISGSYAFSKPRLYVWKFSVHILLKPSLKNFEYNLTSLWNECNCTVVWTFFGILLLCDCNESDLFQSSGHWWVFQIYWHVQWSTQTSSFRIFNISARIPSLSPALLIAMLPKAHLISHSRVSGSRWVTTPFWLSGSLRPFCTILLCILASFS